MGTVLQLHQLEGVLVLTNWPCYSRAGDLFQGVVSQQWNARGLHWITSS